MGACHPVDLPEGYHAAARGQSLARSGAVVLRAARGRPRGRAEPGRRDGTGRRRAGAGNVTRSEPPGRPNSDNREFEKLLGRWTEAILHHKGSLRQEARR